MSNIINLSSNREHPIQQSGIVISTLDQNNIIDFPKHSETLNLLKMHNLHTNKKILNIVSKITEAIALTRRHNGFFKESSTIYIIECLLGEWEPEDIPLILQ